MDFQGHMPSSLRSNRNDIVSWEPEGRYHHFNMFRWEPERRYHCTMYMVKAPFWSSTKHLWIVIVPFWFSTKHLWIVIVPFWFSTKHLWIVIVPFWFSTDNILHSWRCFAVVVYFVFCSFYTRTTGTPACMYVKQPHKRHIRRFLNNGVGGAWLSRGSYGIYVAVTGCSWQPFKNSST